jgi:F-type H+-transporting ATPase subunit gamma
VSSIRDIRSKIRTVRNIEQICRAMKTVASIRLRRGEQRLERARPYHERLARLVEMMAAVTQDHPFLRERAVDTTAMVVVTSDRGLCGGYNAAAVRRALAVGPPENTRAVAIGRKGLVQLRRHGYDVVEQLVPLGGEPSVAAVYALAERLGERFVRAEIDRLVLVHSRFHSGTRSELRIDAILPVAPAPVAPADVIFEPAPQQMLQGLMRRYLQNEILSAVLEASASEHAARVAAMTAATDNAEDMIRQLTLDYNKARQAGITKELVELVSAADSTV